MANSPLEATANEPPRSTDIQGLLMEDVGERGLEEGVTHACNCAAMEYVEAVLASSLDQQGRFRWSGAGPLPGGNLYSVLMPDIQLEVDGPGPGICDS